MCRYYTYFQFQIQVCFLANHHFVSPRSVLCVCMHSRKRFPSCEFFLTCDREIWPMTLTFELELCRVNLNYHVKALWQRSFRLKVIVRTDRRAHRAYTDRLLHSARYPFYSEQWIHVNYKLGLCQHKFVRIKRWNVPAKFGLFAGQRLVCWMLICRSCTWFLQHNFATNRQNRIKNRK